MEPCEYVEFAGLAMRIARLQEQESPSTEELNRFAASRWSWTRDRGEEVALAEFIGLRLGPSATRPFEECDSVRRALVRTALYFEAAFSDGAPKEQRLYKRPEYSVLMAVRWSRSNG
jgi:hypothetical protein